MDTESTLRAHFDRCYVALHRYAAHRGLRGADADDLVAATFEVAWRRRDAVPDDDPLPWLFGVAGNVLRNRRRAERRYAAFLARTPRPETVAQRELTDVSAAEIRAALATLGDRDREVLTLVVWDGLAPQDAAVALGCTSVALRSRLMRARRRLAEALGVTDAQRAPRTAQIDVVGEEPTRPSEAPHG